MRNDLEIRMANYKTICTIILLLIFLALVCIRIILGTIVDDIHKIEDSIETLEMRIIQEEE